MRRPGGLPRPAPVSPCATLRVMGNTRLGFDPDADKLAAALDVIVERIARRVVELSADAAPASPSSTSVTFTDEVLSVREACLALRMGKAKLYEYIRTGELVSFKVGSRRLIRRSDLDAFLRVLVDDGYTGP